MCPEQANEASPERADYWCSGVWSGEIEQVAYSCVSGIVHYPGYTPAPTYPRCEYCGTCAVDKISNCASCGAPLPWS